jgi:hypothetical protein
VLRNDQIQAALVAYLKGKTDITDLTGVDEIREDQWQGTNFSYPNVRVRMISNRPVGGKDCPLQTITVSFMVFSEDASSLEAEQIAGIINNTLNDITFISNGIMVSLRTSNLIPAVRSDERTWRTEALLEGSVSGS